MRAGNARSLAFYRLLLCGYPRRFRARYGDAMFEAFVMERKRVASQGSRGTLAAFWTFMILDLLVGVGATRASDAWSRVVHGAKLIRGSTGFTAALATLVIIPVWAWSRFATYTPAHARDATLTFCVSAVHALVISVIARAVTLSYRVGRFRALHLRYASVRRARLVARVGRMSAVTFAVAAITEAQHHEVRGALVNPAFAGEFWILLALTLAAIIGLYFSLDALLRTRDAS